MDKNIKFIIGCDYDGTLTDLYSFYEKTGTKFFKKNIVNPNEYDLKKLFDVSQRKEIMFGLKHFFSYCKDKSIRKDAAYVLNEETLKGTKVCAITARKYATKNNLLGNYVRKQIIKYAKYNNINFSTYEFCDEDNAKRDKLIACKKLGINLFIDDQSQIALTLAKNNIKVALIDAPYNQKIKHENIKRCYNFIDVKNYIDEVKKSIEKKDNEFEIMSYDKLQNSKKPTLTKYYKDFKNHYLNMLFDDSEIKLGKKRYNYLYYFIIIVTLRFLFVKVKNKENIIYQDGIIFISNHLDSLDQFSIAYAFKNKYLSGYAAGSIKKTIRGRLANFTKSAIFIDRENKESKKNGKLEFDLRVVNGYSTLVFPEGTRKNKYPKYDDKEILDFKLGAFSSAQITGSPIVPITIYKKNKKSKKSTLIVGEHFFVNPDDDLKTVAKKAQKLIGKTIKEERKKENEKVAKKKNRT